MAQSIPQLACYQCNAWYKSEEEVLQHMQAIHRKIGIEQRQGCATSFLAKRENEIKKAFEQTPAQHS